MSKMNKKKCSEVLKEIVSPSSGSYTEIKEKAKKNQKVLNKEH